MRQEILLYLIVLVYGVIIGSFINVLILRIPEKKDVIVKSSSCTKCGHKLQWYDLVPLLSYIFLRGRCRYCKEKISIQYPIIEGLNGLIYVTIFLFLGFHINTIFACLISSLLLAVAVVDFRTYTIADGLNISIFVLALLSLIFTNDIVENLIGFIVVSAFMYLMLIIFRRLKNVDVFGGGDIKLMAAAGLFLGGKRIVLAFFIGCIVGSIIHSLRMKFSEEGNVLAFGPYLCIGIFISMLVGDAIIQWYLSLLL